MPDYDQFRMLIESVTDYAIYMLDRNGCVASWNPGGQRIKGYEASEIIGQHFSRFYTPEDCVAGVPQRALATAAREGRYTSEGWRVRKDGTRFWASVVIDPIRRDGELVGYAKVTRDITERRNAQQQLERSREALARSQRLEAISRLTTGLAHDFNNLMTVIVNSLDLVERFGNDPERRRNLLRPAHRAADHASLLTRQLLTFSRGQPLAPERLDANTLLQRSSALLRRACDETIQIEYRLSREEMPVVVDACQFEAAVLNLVLNSRDAMPQGGRIVIATHATEPGQDGAGAFAGFDPVGSISAGAEEAGQGPEVRVVVTDTGCGMTPDVIERAMDPFFTTKEVGKGSGLGLSQVHGFVCQSGGRILIVSEPGLGTRVELCLPYANTSAATGEEAA
ncbi:MAG TPA: PAS domain S-box protein [Pseudoxanthomonas sp.]|nr:PAS domain S-box protein [Pseudoxanthomonas sp.]